MTKLATLAMCPSPTFVQAPLTRLIPRRTRISHRHICTASLPTLTSLASSLRVGETTPTKLLERTLSRIQAVDPSINAFLSLDVDHLYARAETLDALIASGSAPPLAGVPIAIKDNLCMRHLPTTAASSILDGFYPSYNSTAVQRLLDAGALLVGKTNLDEFGMGSSTETSAYAVTRNPWDRQRVPGGSSGGSAAAVASAMCPAALGTDTGGSIRQPAAFCGLSGLRPSYGRVSRHGMLAYASSLDTVGPICSTVRDCAALLAVIAGRDPMDANTVDAPVPDYLAALQDNGDLSGITIGVVAEAMGDGVDEDVRSAVDAAVDTLRDLGANVRIVSLPLLSAAAAAYYVLAPSEASANLARYDGVRYGVRDLTADNSYDMYALSRANGFGEEVKRRIMVGTYALSSGYYDAYYLRAQRVRALISDDFKRFFAEGIDVMVSPSTPTAAFKIGEKIDDPVSMYLDDLMTIPASLAGLPALNVQCGHTASGLPIGMQLVASFLNEEAIFKVGDAFQNATRHHLQTADIPEGNLTAAEV